MNNLLLRTIAIAIIFLPVFSARAGGVGQAHGRSPELGLTNLASTLLEEDFSTASGTTPPAGWSSRTIEGTPADIWRFDNPGARNISMNANAPYAGFDSDFQSPGGGPEDVTLESPEFSAPLNATIRLQFVQYFRSNPYGTSAVVEAFNGTTWSPVDSLRTTSSIGATACIDITHEVAGVNTARVRFRFRGDDSWYWFVDDVRITSTSIAPAERLVFENFSTATGITPPSGWTQNRIVGASWDNWHFDNPAGRHIALPMTRPVAIFDSDSLSRLGGREDVALESPAFSALASSTVQLRFNQFFHGDSGGRAKVQVFNGSSWVTKWSSTVSSPNPDTMVIDITNETAGVSNARVRFFWHADDWAWWWIIDNIEVVQTPGYTTGGIVSDQFNAPSLNTDVWTFVNPLGDASLTMTGTQLSLHLPAGTCHDITEEGNTAARIMQRVNNPQHFEVFLKCDAVMDQTFQMQGLQIEQDSLNFLRLEFYGDGTNLHRLAWSFVDGIHQDVGTADLGLAATSPLYLKVERQGDVWTQTWSLDGVHFQPGTTFTRAMNITRIGIHAGNVGYPGSTAPAFTGLFDYFMTTNPLPIQLASFSATLTNGSAVRVAWRTLSETNNYGFEIQKSPRSGDGFQTLLNSFVPGSGTTLEPHEYAWTDQGAQPGRWYYRLKQIDLDGTVNYFDPVQVDVLTGVTENAPRVFSLHQNYPNPFNPSTQISFSVESNARTTLTVYNMLGQRVATLYDDLAEPGRLYSVRLNGADLASGLYFYKLDSGQHTALKKALLLK